MRNSQRAFIAHCTLHIETYRLLTQKETRHNRVSLFVLDVNVLLLRRSAYRTDICTVAARNAGICIDLILAVALSNSVYRALSSASTAGNTIVTNFVSHNKKPPKLFNRFSRVYYTIYSTKMQAFLMIIYMFMVNDTSLNLNGSMPPAARRR